MKILKVLSQEGYTALKFVPGRGQCGLTRMYLTIALCYGLDGESYIGKYCFHTKTEARRSLDKWDGSGDPPGNWIKHKGKEYRNPNYVENDI